MSVPIIPPGSASAITTDGNNAPSSGTYSWEVWDNYSSTTVATNLAANGWGTPTLDSSTPRKIIVTPPAGAPIGGDASGTGRFQIRLSAAYVGTL